MKSTVWVLALALSLLPLGELRAQSLGYLYDRGGYGYGGGIVFSSGRRHLSIGGFLGGYGGSRYSSGVVYLADPYGPPYASPYAGPTVTVESRVTVQLNGRSLSSPGSLRDEVAGIDLDLQPSKKKASAVDQGDLPPAPQPPAQLPGADVSKPRPAIRPEDQPPPKVKPQPPQPPKVKPPPPDMPPPEADPRAENMRLVKLGMAAFTAQEYVLAAHRFRQATEVEPKSGLGHFLLAQAQFALGKYQGAVESIHAGMSRTKNWPRAPFHPRADLYKGTEPDFVAQLKRLQGVLAKSPDNPAYLFLTAYQLWFDGRQMDAVPLFRQARALTADKGFIDQFLAAAAGPVAAN
jgi:hypothetical protein